MEAVFPFSHINQIRAYTICEPPAVFKNTEKEGDGGVSFQQTCRKKKKEQKKKALALMFHASRDAEL